MFSARYSCTAQDHTLPKGTNNSQLVFNISGVHTSPSTITATAGQRRVKYAVKYLKSRNASATRASVSVSRRQRTLCAGGRRLGRSEKGEEVRSCRKKSGVLERCKLYSIKYFGIINGEIGVATRQVPLAKYQRILASRSLNRTFHSPTKVKVNTIPSTTRSFPKDTNCRILRIEVKKKLKVPVTEERPATVNHKSLMLTDSTCRMCKEQAIQTDGFLFPPKSLKKPPTELLTNDKCELDTNLTNVFQLSLTRTNIDNDLNKVKDRNILGRDGYKRTSLLHTTFVERRKCLKVLTTSVIGLPDEGKRGKVTRTLFAV
eukprot:TRINITY_DN13163_c0_g1_i1.p1 TRINITY_DN13163_c0_g1~~TRINITY_DN13163_c0_g1_i1.p1  ORF type:complete len:317 (+),score=33.23 TRINITY_DN13163_c0_g1_i1:184-1134(+)